MGGLLRWKSKTVDQKQKILEHFKGNFLGVVSTIDANEPKPQGAVVAFSSTDDLEIIFGSYSDSRKNSNIKNNNKICFTIGWDILSDITVQYEGAARKLEGEELDEAREIHMTKIPQSRKYAHDPKQEFFKVTPNWIRYSDLSQNPANIFEMEF